MCIVVFCWGAGGGFVGMHFTVQIMGVVLALRAAPIRYWSKAHCYPCALRKFALFRRAYVVTTATLLTGTLARPPGWACPRYPFRSRHCFFFRQCKIQRLLFAGCPHCLFPAALWAALSCSLFVSCYVSPAVQRAALCWLTSFWWFSLVP